MRSRIASVRADCSANFADSRLLKSLTCDATDSSRSATRERSAARSVARVSSLLSERTWDISVLLKLLASS